MKEVLMMEGAGKLVGMCGGVKKGENVSFFHLKFHAYDSSVRISGPFYGC